MIVKHGNSSDVIKNAVLKCFVCNCNLCNVAGFLLVVAIIACRNYCIIALLVVAIKQRNF